jgi:hypothetical protein
MISMKTQAKINVQSNETKRTYQAPEVVSISIDHEISLVMMSDPNPAIEPYSPNQSIKFFLKL